MSSVGETAPTETGAGSIEPRTGSVALPVRVVLILVVLLSVLLPWFVAVAIANDTATATSTEAASVPTPETASPAPVEIVAVVPNPAAHGDAGERIVLEFPEPTNVSGWTVADGETVVRFPDRTLSGRVVATTQPEAIPEQESDATVVRLVGRLALANTGETIELQSPAGVVATVTYEDAPEGEQYVRTDEGWVWRVPGTTDLPVVTARDVPAQLFVLPDDPSVPLNAIEGARERVLLAAYTFTSERITGALCAAVTRGVHVEVLVEGEPIGGKTRRQAGALDRLSACGVRVSVLGGPGDRYAVHHAKYAVVDDRALVLSENWKPAGTGGRSSRGWGVLLESPRISGALAETFRADADFQDARPWAERSDGQELVSAPVANGSYPSRFPAVSVRVDRVDLLVAPDNAEPELVRLVDSADETVAVQQVRIGGLDGPFGDAAVRAARRDVPTRVLLSSAWYVREENRRLVDQLNDLGRREGLPLSSRLVSPRSRFEKTHVKGLLVDGEAVVVGSLNWNAYAARENREVVVVIRDPEAAAYYGRVFRADWRGGTWRLPAGYGVAVVIAAVAAAVTLARTVEFDRSDSGTDRIDRVAP